MKINICYIVFGEERHYDNMYRSIKSLQRIKSCSYDIHIFNAAPDQSYSGDFKDHLIWKAKYVKLLEIPEDGEYTLYLDTDTVIANDTIIDLVAEIGDGFGVTQHFWVPNFYDFVASRRERSTDLFRQANLSLGMNCNFPFVAGGAFIFRNNGDNRQVLKKVLELYDLAYPADSTYNPIMTDEVILSKVLHDMGKLPILSGAFNHCAMDEMPSELVDGVLFGSNPFDSEMKPITVLHCDVHRRDPGKCIKNPDVAKQIRKMFYLE